MSGPIEITRAGTGEQFLFGADMTTVRASGQGTAGRLLALEVTVPAGGGPPLLHRHDYAEIFYFLEGTFEISTADERYRLQTERLGAGDVVAIPSLAWHTFKNVGAAAGRFLVVHSSAVMEELLRELGQPLSDPSSPPAPAGPPSEAQLQQLMQVLGRYMEFLPPEKLAHAPQG
jgi:mannose-6-phosphate isomerase-like protein (cupin superfamily)